MSFASTKQNGTLTLAGSSEQLVPKNPYRNGLIISAPAADLWLSLYSGDTGAAVPTAVAGTGLRVPGNGVLMLTGDMNFTGAIRVIGTGAQVVGIVEW